MSLRKVANRITRLKTAMNHFLKAQVWLIGANKGKPCKTREQQIDMASRRLKDGWSASSIRTAAGKNPKNEGWFPQGNNVVRFCEVSGVSADWIFFGEGPMLRRTSAAGGSLAEEQLEAEVSAYVAASLGESEYVKRFAVTVSGRACLDRLLAIAQAEEDAEAGLLAVSDTAIEALNQYRGARLEQTIPAAPAIVALKAIVAERATLASNPRPVNEPRLLVKAGGAAQVEDSAQPSRDFKKILDSLGPRSTGLSTSEMLMSR